MEKQWEEKLIANVVTFCVRKIRCGKFELISDRYQYLIPSLSKCDSFFRNFVVGRVTRLWVGRSRNYGLIPGRREEYFFLLQSLQTDIGSRLIFYSVATGELFPAHTFNGTKWLSSMECRQTLRRSRAVAPQPRYVIVSCTEIILPPHVWVF
jgi:hypothetical protein